MESPVVIVDCGSGDLSIANRALRMRTRIYSIFWNDGEFRPLKAVSSHSQPSLDIGRLPTNMASAIGPPVIFNGGAYPREHVRKFRYNESLAAGGSCAAPAKHNASRKTADLDLSHLACSPSISTLCGISANQSRSLNEQCQGMYPDATRAPV